MGTTTTRVQFVDIAYVEAQQRYAKGRSAKDKLLLAIELTDTSVHYTQGAAEAAQATLKEGKSAVVCEKGPLYKLSKSKDGVVTRERLTKAWTDWVDNWAVESTVAVKVIDIFGNDTMTLVPVNVR